MSSALNFSEAEVMEELRELGYDNIPRDKLAEFITDLRQLMRHHDENSRLSDDLSFASSTAHALVDDASASISDGLARYPQHTDFHWGRGRRKGDENDAESTQSTPRSAFEKSKVPLEENSFYNESFFGRDRTRDDDDEETSPKRIVRAAGSRLADDSVSSSSNSLVVKRKTSRRDAHGNRDICTEELTYIEDDDDDAATLIDGDDAILDDDDDIENRRNTFGSAPLPRRVGGRRPRSAESESSNASSGASSYSRPLTGLPSFIRPLPEPRRKRHDPVNRYHQYNEAWAAQRAPGEKQHKQLRWAVREQMQRREEIVTPIQKHYVPNDFVPPTDKKRQNLRWEIRTKLAHKLNPSQTAATFNIWS